MLIDLFSNKDIIQTNICWYTHGYCWGNILI